MALYTSAEIKAKIEALDLKIAKAETAQEYTAGVQMGLKRGALEAMYAERARLTREYEKAEAQESGSFINRAEFGRPG
jgi:predicted porin